MDLLKRLGLLSAPSLPDALDEKLYEMAAGELATNQQRPGLMAKAFADAEGEENKAIAFYLRLRVEQLRGEVIEAFTEMQRQRTVSSTHQDGSRTGSPPRPDTPPCERCARFKRTGVIDRFKGVCLLTDETTYTTWTCSKYLPARAA